VTNRFVKVNRYFVLAITLSVLVFCASKAALAVPGVNDAFENNDILDLDSLTGTDTNEVKFSQRSEDSLLIVGVVIDDLILDQGFIIYLTDSNEILVPVQYLANLLELSLDVIVEEGAISGWIVEEGRTLAAQYPFKNYTFGGETVDFESHDIVEIQEGDDIYVSQSVIEKWFPVNIDFNFNELRLYMGATEDLPFQAQAKRRVEWNKLPKKRLSDREELDEDVIRFSNKLYSLPVIEVNQSVTGSKTQQQKRTNSNQFLGLNGDLLFMETRATINYTTDTGGLDQFQNAFFNMSKTDKEGNIGGFLKATEFEIGDTTTYNFPLASGQQRGRGTKITNKPDNFVRDPNDFIVEGFAPFGWDIELYQDGRLIDFQTVDEEGRYLFNALPLRGGFNLFKIVLYGPNGQKEERFERFFLGQNMIEPGKFVYEASALESSTPLFDLRENEAEPTDHTLSFMGEYGITKNISANAGYFEGPFSNSNLKGFGAGLRTSGKSTFAQADYFKNQDGGTSYSLDLTGNLGKTLRWSAGYLEHDGYEEDLRNVQRQMNASFSHQLSLGKLQRINYSFQARRRELADDVTTDTFTNRLSSSFLGINVTNELDYQISSNTETDLIPGRLTARQKVPWGFARGRFNYNLNDGFTADSLELQLQSRFSKDVTFNAGVNSTFGDTPINTFTSNVDVDHGKFRVGYDASYSDNGDIRGGLNLIYNFVPQSYKGDYRMTGSNFDVASGTLILDPFIDINQDGVKNDNEKTLEDVEFKNLLKGKSSETNDDGLEILQGVAPNTVNKIKVQDRSLTDIYLTPGKSYISVLGRKGINGPVPYPIHQLGELSGVVKAIDPETQDSEIIENLYMTLMDVNGDIVAETYSEFDGFYSFPSLPIGSYQIFLPPSETLNTVYIGDGNGPNVTVSVDEPEFVDADLLVGVDKISFR